MKNFLRNLLPGILILTFTTGYSYGQIHVAVSKSYRSYEAWLHAADPNLIIVNMYGVPVDSAILMLSGCQGLLLTGGEDVNPVYYGKENELSKCEEIDNYRDSLEIALIKRAMLIKMPVLGICRGEQIINVALGGTLLTDIPSDVGTQVTHRCPPGSNDCLHSVIIDKESNLFRMTGIEKGIVNSFHHQAVDLVAPGMKITAVSENGVTEAIERDSPEGKSFVMGVQWHPERLSADPGLSKPLADYFVAQMKSCQKNMVSDTQDRSYFVTHDRGELISKLIALPCGINAGDPVNIILKKLHAYLQAFRPSSGYPDDVYAREANLQALKSVMEGGYGIGSVLIDHDGKIIEVAHNDQIQKHRSDLHAEMTLLTNFEESHKAKKFMNVYIYKPGLIVFSSTEPCPMCYIRINTTGADTKYCAPGPDDGMASRIDYLPPYWKEMALKRKIGPGNCSPEMQKISHLLFYSFLLDNRGPGQD